MAITKGNVIVVNGADASSGSYTSSAFDSTGGGAVLYFVGHEGAPTTYTWSDSTSTPGGRFLTLGTINCTVGSGAGDLSLTAVVVWSPTVSASHTITCTFGASRPFRYGGGVVLNGRFESADILSATTQTAEGNSVNPVDAGSLVTDNAAFLFHAAVNYFGVTAAGAGSGWTLDSNASGGRHFQTRNEAASGTFDPSLSTSSSTNWVTIAAAIRESPPQGPGVNAPQYGTDRPDLSLTAHDPGSAVLVNVTAWW